MAERATLPAVTRALLAWLLVAGAVVLVLTGCGAGPGSVDVEVLELDGDVVTVLVVTDELWVVADHDRDGEAVRSLHRLDPERGQLLDTTVLANGLFPVGTAGGRVWATATDPIDGVPTADHRPAPAPGHDAVVALDPETLEPRFQILLPDHLLTVAGGWLRAERWVVADHDRLLAVDLETGQVELARPYRRENLDEPRRFLAATDDQQVELRGERLVVLNLDSLRIVSEHQLGDGAGVRLVGDVVWVTGEAVDGSDRFHRLDLVTGALSDPTAPGDLARRSVDAGGYRWELLADSDDTADGDDGPTWRQVEPGTGEVVGRQDFGSFDVRVAAGGHLWLTNRTTVGRVPLSTLKGGR